MLPYLLLNLLESLISYPSEIIDLLTGLSLNLPFFEVSVQNYLHIFF